ncbi:MAG: ATP-binding protein [Gammaproteobacteria bacterium]
MKFYEKYRKNPEFTQALLRLVIWLTISFLVWIQFAANPEKMQIEEYIAFMALFLVFAIIIFISILIIPKSKLRPYLTALPDLGAVSYTMILTTAGPFSAYYLLFPWIFVGYGARYGRGPLLTAAIVGMVGYLYVLWLFDSWTNDAFSSILFTLFFIILPVYVSKMITQLKISQQEAIDANKGKSEFLAAMSHEIRTPMSGIIGMTSLLEKTNLDQTQSEYVAALQQSSAALHALIDDILDLSKIEAGKYKLRETKFNLPKLIHSVVQLLTPTANIKKIELINFIQPDIPRIVIGDPDKLRQILLNLLSNAVKFTSEGEVNIKASVIENKGDELVRIRIDVSDTGIGIPNQQLEKIFEPFYQGKNVNPVKHSGTGLGTTISHQLTTLMNGEIGACSDLNKGSIFWIEIPFHYCEYQNENLTLPHPDATKLIVFDDIKSSATATENYLNSLDINPIMLKEEQEVIDYLTEYNDNKRITVILTESHRYPDIFSFSRKLKNNFSSKIYLILITNIEKIDLLNKEYSDLFDDYIIRPFGVFMLKQTIASLYSDNEDKLLQDNSAEITTTQTTREQTVLVAEDSDINAKVICIFLEQEGYKTKRVISGKEALTELINTKYDFVFMDMRMPEMDGLEATRRWRQQDMDTDIKPDEIKSEVTIPIVALTANATTEDQEACLNSGMDKFLSKPVSKENMIDVINSFLKT